jgi:hypothetical protein
MSPLPSASFIRRSDTHRLVPSKYTDSGDSVLARIANDSDHLADIFDLDNATNDRLLAEHELVPGIGIDELVFRIPYASIINAAFTHAHPLGSRFNGPDRGAWYAAFEVETSQAEVAFHKTVDLAEIERFDDEVTYDDYLADFRAEFYDIRDNQAFAEYLNPDSYVESQGIAERLLASGALGIVYPSARRARRTCIVCFRPALVTNVRRGQTYRFVWDGTPTPTITAE